VIPSTPPRTGPPVQPRATRLTKPLPPLEQKSPLESVLQQLHVTGRKPGTTIGASLESAMEAIWANRLRSLLTMLGIFIGVGAVIAALTLTQGASAYISNRIESLGINSIIVFPGTSREGGASQGSSSLQTLTPRDAQTLESLPHVVAVSPIITVSEQVVYGNQNWTTTVEGVNTQFQSIQGWTMAQGLWFSTNDDQTGNSVALLGDTVAHSLFDASGTNPLGQTIRIGTQVFHVAGVLAAKGSGQDDVVFIPFNTARIRLKNTTTVDQILVEADTTNNVNAVQQAVTKALEKNHHIQAGGIDDFNTVNFAQFLQTSQQVTQTLTFLLVGIAAISLTVGGVGIMNIMLVSVTERTREIGIRMSVGARRRDIRNQFLIEALVLCLAGAAIGTLLGLLIGYGVTNLFRFPFVVTTITIALPVVVSVGITVIFGLYPAIQAARLDPIEALRDEE
jgi:putative ABC transport system permease protein